MQNGSYRALVLRDLALSQSRPGGPITFLEGFEALAWLTARDAPKDCAVTLLETALAEASATQREALSRLLARILTDQTLDDAHAMRDLLRGLLRDAVQAEITREYDDSPVVADVRARNRSEARDARLRGMAVSP